MEACRQIGKRPRRDNLGFEWQNKCLL
uniref:Uncharacterized protein n=1 Tax=Rhizophora mucronata TaxID=61149 RepID=A0A2P2JWB2_RHIMU